MFGPSSETERPSKPPPGDTPYASRLILGWLGARPVHVVADDAEAGETVVMTVDEPTPDLWENGFRRRKRR